MFYLETISTVLHAPFFSSPSEHNERQVALRALRNRQDLFQEEGILNLILDAIDKITVITGMGFMVALAGEEAGMDWDVISGTMLLSLPSSLLLSSPHLCFLPHSPIPPLPPQNCKKKFICFLHHSKCNVNSDTFLMKPHIMID